MNNNYNNNQGPRNPQPQRNYNPLSNFRNPFSQGPKELRVCTLSGTNEIGRNCSFIEFGNTILLIDCGFSFPEAELYGIDYLIPNTRYLEKNKHKIKGILITHGHLDHTGALSYILPKLNYPAVYAGSFSNALIKERLAEFKLDNNKVKLIDVNRNTDIQIGDFRVTFIGVTHSIPNSFSIFVQSPKGNVFFSGDYKIDEEPANEEETDYSKLRSLQGKVDLALMESTNANEEGKSRSSMQVERSLDEIIASWKGRVIVASFSSIVSRTYSLFRIARNNRRKVAIFGRSLHTSIDIAQKQNYLKVEQSELIPDAHIKEHQDGQVMVMCTGSQGEQFAALNLISQGKHKYIKIKPGDLVILSSSEIPGNIIAIQHMTDRLIAAGAEIIKDNTMFVHETGHGLILDMKMMYDMIKPKAAMPIHGWLTIRYLNKKNFVNWGMSPDKVHLTEDGQIWKFDGINWKKDVKVESKPILIDGLGVGDVGDAVIKDRQQLAEFGVLTVVLNLHNQTKKLLGKPMFISRGFVYTKTSQKLLGELSNLVKDIHQEWYMHNPINKSTDELREKIEKGLGKYIHKVTERNPMILTVIT